RTQSLYWIASLKVPLVALSIASSSMPRKRLTFRIWGMVDSPTPTVPMASDSTTWIPRLSPIARLKTAAAIQPAVPPPTMTTRLMRKSLTHAPYHMRRRDPPALAGGLRRDPLPFPGLDHWKVYEKPTV